MYFKPRAKPIKTHIFTSCKDISLWPPVVPRVKCYLNKICVVEVGWGLGLARVTPHYSTTTNTHSIRCKIIENNSLLNKFVNHISLLISVFLWVNVSIFVRNCLCVFVCVCVCVLVFPCLGSVSLFLSFLFPCISFCLPFCDGLIVCFCLCIAEWVCLCVSESVCVSVSVYLILVVILVCQFFSVLWVCVR